LAQILKFNSEYFFNGYYSLKDDRLYYILHGWEYVLFFIILGVFIKNIKVKSFLLALAFGMLFHLMIDLVINSETTAKGYSIIHKIRNNFKIEKTITFDGYQQHLSRKQEASLFSQENAMPVSIPSEDVQIVENVEETATASSLSAAKNISLIVPFVLQAPFGNWDDPLFQDACEEAAILMADGWLEGKISFTKEQMETGIRKIADLEKKMLGGFIDTSAKDTAKILENFSGQGKVRLGENIKLEDIVGEISAGNLVIVPTDGRKLKNPFYTAPGPVTHMIVIIGYDVDKKEFITNDSGTMRGKDYRYSEAVLFGAIRDYPTGSHYVNPIDESKIEKTMIVVEERG